MGKKKNKTKICILVLIIGITFFPYLYNTFAKYLTSINKKSDLEVAKWNVSLETNDKQLDIITGDNPTIYNLKVTSNSEVGFNYTLELSNIPNDIQVSIDGENYTNPSENKLKFDLGKFTPSEINTTKEINIFFKAPSSAEDQMKEINIDVTFDQLKPETK